MTQENFIILIEFKTIEEGLNFMNESENYFSFSVKNKTYSSVGQEIKTPDNSSIIYFGDIFIGIIENPMPGELFIENGFLQYYKEI